MILETLLSSGGLVVALVTCVLVYVGRRCRRQADLPPGPPCLPLLGNLLWMVTGDQLTTFRELRKRYGDVFSLMVGHRTVIVLNGYDTLREAFIKNGDVFSDRPRAFAFDEMAQQMGVIGRSGPIWKEQRTFAWTSLRELGFGRNILETKIAEEVETLIEMFDAKDGKAFDGSDIISAGIGNVIGSIVLGKTYPYDDPVLLRIIQMNNENSELLGLSGMLNFYPELRYLPGDLFGAKKIANNMKKIRQEYGRVVTEYKARYDEWADNGPPSNYIEAYLQEMERRGTAQEHSFTEKQLLFMLTDVFGAGFVTTVTAIRWAILYLIKNPKVQHKMRQEMNVVTPTRPPSLQDRSRLRYCEAVINEILRRGDIVPIILPHGTTRDVFFKGLLIPKDAILIPNGNSVHFDPELFDNPEEFRPERFLDEEGNLTGLDKIVAFSLGRRTCLGESLARMEMYLYLTRLVQVFKLEPETDDTQPSFQGNIGVTFSPHPFRFRATRLEN